MKGMGAFLSAAALVALGCSANDAAFAPPTPAQTVYWRLAVNYKAVNLSLDPPYDTLRLVVVPRRYDGGAFSPPSDVPVTTTYLVDDSSKVSVTNDGLLHARSPGSRIAVIISQQIGNVTHADTTLVNIFANPDTQPLSRFSVRLVDSTKRAQFGVYSYPITALDYAGAPVTGLVTYTTTADTTIAAPFGDRWGPVFRPKTIAQTLVTATTWRFGRVYTDTFTLSVTRKLSGAFTVLDTVVRGVHSLRMRPGRDTVGPGGDITWINATTAPFDVIFDDPTNVVASPKNRPAYRLDTGNILGVPSDTSLHIGTSRLRRIVVPGTYPFHIVPGNVQGTLVITDQ